MLFKKFCTGLITGLMKDLAGLLNLLSLSTSTCQLIDHYQEVLSYIKLTAELRLPKEGLINIKK